MVKHTIALTVSASDYINVVLCPLTYAVTVYTLQTFTDVLKAVRKTGNELQGMQVARLD